MWWLQCLFWKCPRTWIAQEFLHSSSRPVDAVSSRHRPNICCIVVKEEEANPILETLLDFAGVSGDQELLNCLLVNVARSVQKL
jgi:hypothetical protein